MYGYDRKTPDTNIYIYMFASAGPLYFLGSKVPGQVPRSSVEFLQNTVFEKGKFLHVPCGDLTDFEYFPTTKSLKSVYKIIKMY